MTRFAFYGRVSTEDQQDPASSKAWQLLAACRILDSERDLIVAEYFDIGQSRSLPWKRRPQATALLDALRDPNRGFDAVVIGEPARAFYGAQFQNTFPLFTHYGVQLWVPDVGGYVDPASDGAEMMMAIYGTMSTQERRRIKMRVRTAMAAQAATEGRFLGGRPPYGYRLVDAGAHPNPGKAADGKRLHRLEPDPVAAPMVQRIFAEYIAGAGLYAIAEGLTADGVPSPSGHDPARNRHRASSRGAWGKSAVRAILGNPRYTGREVWNRQRRDEVLLDVEDVAGGYETKLKWNDRADWVWSAAPAHEAIIDVDTFAAAQAVRGAGAHRPTEAKRHTTSRRYALSGLVRCAICTRRMQGTWNNNRAHYRCTYAAEYALKRGLDEHPRTVYLREDKVLAELDAWLAKVFDPEQFDATQQAIAMATEPDDGAVARAEGARRKLADCDARLAKYRAALEAGADPVIVAGWMAEVRGERIAAERELNSAAPTAPGLTADEIRTLVAQLHQTVGLLGQADPKLRAEIYAELGVQIVYDAISDHASVEAQPCSTERVGGALRTISTWPVLRGELLAA